MIIGLYVLYQYVFINNLALDLQCKLRSLYFCCRFHLSSTWGLGGPTGTLSHSDSRLELVFLDGYQWQLFCRLELILRGLFCDYRECKLLGSVIECNSSWNPG